MFQLDTFRKQQFRYYYTLNDKHLSPSTYKVDEKKMKRKAKFVFGIPTVQRPEKNYLLITLQSLIENLNVTERNKTLLVLLIAEIDAMKVNNITSSVHSLFGEHIESGLLEIIYPPISYYPEYINRNTLEEQMFLVRWRTKQNLDFAFLMNYCKDRAEYYIQLEDDLITRENYIQLIEKRVKDISQYYKDWFLINFATLGFIGKLFKATDLPMLISVFHHFSEYQPVDWLLDYILRIRYCSIMSAAMSCALDIAQHSIS
ncbi:Alpha-1:3-mannosyl-glycoprotein 4-beta-N-acetylglucosaminyltransferase B-like protein, partial [Leptotrombidium deliense]